MVARDEPVTLAPEAPSSDRAGALQMAVRKAAAVAVALLVAANSASDHTP